MVYDSTYFNEKPNLEQIFHEYCDTWFITRLHKSEAYTILDIGGGDGRLTNKLIESGFGVTYNDISMELCSAHVEKGIDVQVGDFLSLVPQPKKYDCLLFSFGVLNHITLEKAWNLIEKWKPKQVLGWISNTTQLEYYLKFPPKKLEKFLMNNYDYSLISSNQYEKAITGITIMNYSYDELSKYFQIIIPYPTYLWLADWKQPPQNKTIKFLNKLDRIYPNKEFCSGFLVEKYFYL